MDDFNLHRCDHDNHDDLDGDMTVPCPFCNQPVFEDSPRCSECGNYLSDADFRRRSPWMSNNTVVAIVIILLVAWLLQSFA